MATSTDEVFKHLDLTNLQAEEETALLELKALLLDRLASATLCEPAPASITDIGISELMRCSAS